MRIRAPPPAPTCMKVDIVSQAIRGSRLISIDRVIFTPGNFFSASSTPRRRCARLN